MKKILLCLVFCVINLNLIYSQITWDFSTSNPSSTSGVTDYTAGDVTINNTTTAQSSMLNSSSPSTSGFSGGNNAQLAARSGSLNKDVSASGSSFYEVTLTPASGSFVTIAGISFGMRSTGTGPTNFVINASTATPTNPYETNLASGTFGTTNAWTYFSSPLSITSALNQVVVLRLYVYGGTSASAGNCRIDDLKIHSSLSTLPISLTSFTAKPIDKTILLNWKTASETNNQSFELQRSADGKNFTIITTLDGAGNSDSEKNYSFIDENPFAGTNYYKLVQYDINGQSSSKTISVDSKLETAQVFVSASNSSVDLNISSPNFTKATVYLYDLEGSKIAEQGLSLSKGNNALSIAQSLTPGIYFVSLVTDEARINAKFAKW